MAYARVSYTGDGSTKIFSVPFPYLDASYVEVRVAGVLKTVTTHYTWLTSSTIQFVTAPPTGATVFLLRNTPKELRLVNYQDAAILREADLDLDSDQAFHIAQETLDASVNSRAVEIFVGGTHYTAGVTTSLTLGDSTVEKPSLTVLFDAAVQQQTEYSLASGVITFTSPIPVGVLQVQVSYAAPLATGLIDGSVTTPKILDGAVTTVKMADGSVTTPKIVDLNVTTAKIADSAATTIKIADLNVTTAKLADGSVTSVKLGSGSVSQAKLGNNVAGNGPVFSAFTSSSQSLSSGVSTKVTFGSKVVDSNSNFASSRFTPTVPGYYLIAFSVNLSGTSITAALAGIFVNGVSTYTGGQYGGPGITSFDSSACAVLFMNGTSDYVEIYTTTTATSPSINFGYFNGSLVRST